MEILVDVYEEVYQLLLKSHLPQKEDMSFECALASCLSTKRSI